MTTPTHEQMAAEIAMLRTALRFYAGSEHFVLDEAEGFDSVSGEPENWLCSGLDSSTTMVEDGTIARMALKGSIGGWVCDGEDHTPKRIDGEVSCLG